MDFEVLSVSEEVDSSVEVVSVEVVLFSLVPLLQEVSEIPPKKQQKINRLRKKPLFFIGFISLFCCKAIFTGFCLVFKTEKTPI